MSDATAPRNELYHVEFFTCVYAEPVHKCYQREVHHAGHENEPENTDDVIHGLLLEKRTIAENVQGLG